jgi:hypothetical protein
MNMQNVDKKLREAEFFLDKMRKQERKAFGDKERFDFYLSAFLNAARTVDYRLRHEQGEKYETWRKAWGSKLAPAENGLIKFMVDDRNVEVHESGSGRMAEAKEVKVGTGGSYSDSSGTLLVMGSPGPMIGSDTGVTIHMSRYYFTIAGTERIATEACAEYLALLARMVSGYKTEVAQ